ncbi:alpha-L-fucosidase [Isosphaeraceae bacterium EP7]
MTRRQSRLAPLIAAFGLILMPAVVRSQAVPELKPPTEAQSTARARYRADRFGLFVHWGVYSQLADGEWVLNNHKIQTADYEPLAGTWCPDAFNAKDWVDLARSAGMKYITVTAKHHDGFCLFDSKQTDWDVVDRTPGGRDIIKELAAECQLQGIKLFLYYSHLDWHHPDYFPRGLTGRNTGRAEAGDWNHYLDYLDAQLTELLTGYGPIAGIWFDGWWDKPAADWRLDRTYALIHRLQPGALVGNNHHRKPFPGEDIQMFEKDLPGRNDSGLNADNAVGTLPLESCETINRAWGYNSSDQTFKSPKQLIQSLVRAAGADANFLLNVGPRPDGTIQPQAVERLKAVGAWLNTHGESIYGTRSGPTTAAAWGVSTADPIRRRVYLHLLDRESLGDELSIAGFQGKVASIHTWDKAPVAHQILGDRLILSLKGIKADPIDTILVLELAADAD